jgi:hypothetical protein
MQSKNLILLLIILFVLSAPGFSHDKSKDSDSTKTWNWEDFKSEIEKFQKKGKPALSLSYGFSRIKLKDINTSFAKPNLLELKLGHASESLADFDEITKYRFTNVFLSYVSTELSKNNAVDGLRSSLWRFGGSFSSGYGYNFGDQSIVLYNSGSFNWSKLDLKDFPTEAQEKERLDRFNNSFRFGTSVESGIRFKIIPLIAVEAGYERAIIFERHLFWKWFGSEVIYFAGQGVLDAFIHEIKDSSPIAAPVVSFVLKSALSYGMYELRQDKMNWPFASAAPLAYDQFKFGISFIF